MNVQRHETVQETTARSREEAATTAPNGADECDVSVPADGAPTSRDEDLDSSQAQAPSLVQAAQRHVAEGWRVFPVWPGTRVPHITRWPREASSDPDQIRRWWARWPDAGIGGATGFPFLVADVDDDTVYDLLASQGVTLPPTRTQTTSRGRHYIYRVLQPAGSRGHSAYYGRMDVQGTGKSIVLAPTLHPSGIRYQMDGNPYADAPRWLLDHAGHPLTKPKVASGAVHGPSRPPGRSWLPPVPPEVQPLLNHATDRVGDKALRDQQRKHYRDRSRVIAHVVGLLQVQGWSVAAMFEVLKDSTLMSHYEGRSPEKELMKDINGLVTKNLVFQPVLTVTVEEHWLAARAYRLTDSQHKVLWAHYRVAERAGKTYGYGASRDNLLLLSGVSTGSITTANRHLLHLGLLLALEHSRGGHRKSIWALVLPTASHPSESVKILTPAPPSPANPSPCVCRGQNLDVLPEWDGSRYQALGQSWTVLYALCPTHEQTTQDLAVYLGRKPPSLRYHLRRLARLGLAVQTTAGYLLHPNAPQILEDLAVEKHTAGSHAKDQHMVAMRKQIREDERKRFAQEAERRRRQRHALWGFEVAEQLHRDGTISDQSLNGSRAMYESLAGSDAS